MVTNDSKTAAAVPHRPLGMVREILESLGMDISYVYDDLVFLHHNQFLLQFGEAATDLRFFRNSRVTAAEAQAQFAMLQSAGLARGFHLLDQGSFSFSDEGNDTLSLQFFEKTAEP
jgi:hypothetical protein